MGVGKVRRVLIGAGQPSQAKPSQATNYHYAEHSKAQHGA
jgi:hypothetical protein